MLSTTWNHRGHWEMITENTEGYYSNNSFSFLVWLKLILDFVSLLLFVLFYSL